VKKPIEAPILSVFHDDNLVCEIRKTELPCEKTSIVFASNMGSQLRFVDNAGAKHCHKLSYESGYFHLHVHVNENFVCQADCLVSTNKEIAPDAFQNLEVNGIRFQPFFLSGSGFPKERLKGRGLFYRGLHYPGRVTPGNVSLSCICGECAKNFRIKSFHAGFSDMGYFYSGSGKETLVLSNNIKGCPPALGEANMAEVKELEAKLPKAKDGTSFSYLNGFRCPHCGAKYIDFESNPKDREHEYYGNYFYGDELTTYKESSG
jgi:hypothetical protein